MQSVNHIVAPKFLCTWEEMNLGKINYCYWRFSFLRFQPCFWSKGLAKLQRWPFVRGIHQSPVVSLRKGQYCRVLMFLVVNLNKSSAKELSCWWFEMTWCSCDQWISLKWMKWWKPPIIPVILVVKMHVHISLWGLVTTYTYKKVKLQNSLFCKSTHIMLVIDILNTQLFLFTFVWSSMSILAIHRIFLCFCTNLCWSDMCFHFTPPALLVL